MTMLLLRDSSDEEQLSRTITMATRPNTADDVSSDISNYISIQSDLDLRWVAFSTDSSRFGVRLEPRELCFPTVSLVSEAVSTNPDGAGSDTSDAPFCCVTSAETCSLQDQDLRTVMVCPPDAPPGPPGPPGVTSGGRAAVRAAVCE